MSTVHINKACLPDTHTHTHTLTLTLTLKPSPTHPDTCLASPCQWDSKITTLPGLYLFSIGLNGPVSWVLGRQLCDVFSLRVTNLVAAAFMLSSFHKLLTFLHGNKVGTCSSGSSSCCSSSSSSNSSSSSSMGKSTMYYSLMSVFVLLSVVVVVVVVIVVVILVEIVRKKALCHYLNFLRWMAGS